MKKYDYLIAPNGKKLDYDGVIEYMEIKNDLIRQIKGSPQYNLELESGNLTYFNSIMKKLELRTPDNEVISDQEIKKSYLQQQESEKKTRNL